jgi:hypothetical protein
MVDPVVECRSFLEVVPVDEYHSFLVVVFHFQ